MLNELQIKKEKMQLELCAIEEELFELSKGNAKEVESITQEWERIENEVESNDEDEESEREEEEGDIGQGEM